jgi:general secretion pathway protein G
MRSNRRTGFSLIEVMIVVVIIGLMAGVITYATASYVNKAKRNKAKADISQLVTAVESYYLDQQAYPDNQKGLKALAPAFIKVLPNDPWGRPYQYVSPAEGKRPYRISSLGADGRPGGSGADADITDADIDAPGARR